MNSPCVVPKLPSELHMEILSWLPVKTLMQFTCVSKSWKSLIINDPAFAELHLKRSPKNMHVLFTFDDGIDYENKITCFSLCSMFRLLGEPSPKIKEDRCYRLKEKFFVVGSCNGLICLGNSYEANLIEELWVELWNPITLLRSEKSPTLQMNLRNLEFTLWGKMNFGFGYDDSHDTYKVVVVLWNCNEQKMETWTYCMGNSPWSKSDCDSPLLLKQKDGQFVGGCINWLGLDKLNGRNYGWDKVTRRHLVIVSFDMSKEVYEYMSLPQGVSEVAFVEPNIGVVGNHMFLFHDHERTDFVVWKMRDYGVRESWTRLVSVRYEHLQCGLLLFGPRPLCLSKDGDFLLLACTGEAVLYNPRDNSVEYIQFPNNNYLSSVNGYVQSLVSPRRD